MQAWTTAFGERRFHRLREAPQPVALSIKRHFNRDLALFGDQGELPLRALPAPSASRPPGS